MSNPYANMLSFVVDPQRDGVDNALWYFPTGTGAVASNKFRFNTAEGVVRSDLLYGRYEFNVTFPLTGSQTVTNLVNDIEFGLKNLSLGNLGKIYAFADKSEDKFFFRTYDDQGVVQETEITWHASGTLGWNGVAARFRIEWFNDRVIFSVLTNTSSTWEILATHKVRVGVYPLNPYVKVVGAENFDVAYILVEKAKESSIMLI